MSGHDSGCGGWGASNDAGWHGGRQALAFGKLVGGGGNYDDGRWGTTYQHPGDRRLCAVG